MSTRRNTAHKLAGRWRLLAGSRSSWSPRQHLRRSPQPLRL